jgi:hypothetical protein
MEFTRLIFSRVMSLHIHGFLIFFGLRCCDSMGDMIFTNDSGFYRTMSNTKLQVASFL